MDHRPANALIERMFTDQGHETAEYNEGIYVEVESWQILSRSGGSGITPAEEELLADLGYGGAL